MSSVRRFAWSEVLGFLVKKNRACLGSAGRVVLDTHQVS